MVQLTRVGDICNRTPVHTCRSTAVSEAARIMLEQHVGSVVIVEETDVGPVAVGMLTDRDITIAVVARDFNAQTLRVGDVMSRAPIACREDDPIADVIAAMRRGGVRRVLVTDVHDVLVGIIAMDDLLEMMARELQSLAQIIDKERSREIQFRG